MSKLDDSDDEEQVFKQFKVREYYVRIQALFTVIHVQIILLGDGAVGKTSIANRFADDKFAQTYK